MFSPFFITRARRYLAVTGGPFECRSGSVQVGPVCGNAARGLRFPYDSLGVDSSRRNTHKLAVLCRPIFLRPMVSVVLADGRS